MFSNATYDKLKFVALVLLPALGTLYFTLSGLWNLPNPTAVVGTITAIDTFLGVILGITTKNYNASDSKYDGDIGIFDGNTNGNATIKVGVDDPRVLLDKNEVTLKVLKSDG